MLLGSCVQQKMGKLSPDQIVVPKSRTDIFKRERKQEKCEIWRPILSLGPNVLLVGPNARSEAKPRDLLLRQKINFYHQVYFTQERVTANFLSH